MECSLISPLTMDLVPLLGSKTFGLAAPLREETRHRVIKWGVLMLVLQDAMPDITLEPWPVRTVIDPSRLLTDYKSLKGVFLEWAKWRVTTLA